jgi:hypothetical protein
MMYIGTGTLFCVTRPADHRAHRCGAALCRQGEGHFRQVRPARDRSAEAGKLGHHPRQPRARLRGQRHRRRPPLHFRPRALREGTGRQGGTSRTREGEGSRRPLEDAAAGRVAVIDAHPLFAAEMFARARQRRRAPNVSKAADPDCPHATKVDRAGDPGRRPFPCADSAPVAWKSVPPLSERRYHGFAALPALSGALISCTAQKGPGGGALPA